MWPLSIRGVFGCAAICFLLATGCTPLPETPAPLPSPTPVDLARDQPPASLYVVAHDDLLLRTQPGHAGDASGAIRRGAQAQVVTADTRLEWLQVDCPGDDACWVRHDDALTTLADAGQLAADRLATTRRVDPVRLTLPVQTAQLVTATATLTTMDHYLVHAAAGETLSIQLEADNHAYFAVTAVDEAVTHKDLTDPAAGWRAMLHHTQDYLISVATSVPGTTYELYVGRAAGHSAAVLPPVRIPLADGAGTQRLTGKLVTGLDNRYIVHAPAGALLGVKLAAPEQMTGFAIVGVNDGRAYKSMEDGNRAWSAMAPTSQDYLIIVGTDSDSQSGREYEVTVSVQ